MEIICAKITAAASTDNLKCKTQVYEVEFLFFFFNFFVKIFFAKFTMLDIFEFCGIYFVYKLIKGAIFNEQ